MADYIYLFENRLSGAQQSALAAVREIARAKGLTVFLVGGAVRDLTSGSPVRDLDVAVQGNALKLRKELEKAGAQISGEYEPLQRLFLRFAGNVRMELSSTVDITYPKPGRPAVTPATIQEDLRRRDFTANAMALSLNEGSFGLLMDPLNGVADIENRELRLVSNYGFIEDPVRMIRAVRLGARLGWHLEERTQSRYETGKAEGYISAMQPFQSGYELEEIVHEEDPVRVLSRLEAEGWMQVLCPAWTTAKVNAAELERLRETQAQLGMQGVVADASAAQFPLLTAKMSPKDIASLKKLFPRQGFVAEIDALEAEGKQFAAELASKQATTPSAAWRMIMSAPPDVVLWVAYSTRSTALQNKFKSFYTDWPAARQRIPYALMQEMRILPELEGYNELLDDLFFALMDARLNTPEEMKAFLEPHSPPAPPPPVNARRGRTAGKAARGAKAKKRPEEATGHDGTPPDDLAAGAPEESAELGQTASVPAEQARAAATDGPEPVRRAASSSRTAAAAAKSAAVNGSGRKAPAAPARSRKEPEAAPAKESARSGKTPPKKSAAAKSKPAPKPAVKSQHAAAPSRKSAPAGAGAKKVARKAAVSKRTPPKTARAAGASSKPVRKGHSAGKVAPKVQRHAAKASPARTAATRGSKPAPARHAAKAATAKKTGRR